MSRVFLADTSDFVEITLEQRGVTLEQICAAFHVDAASAFIRRANSGAVVATRPSDTLPEISESVEYVLCAAGVGSSSSAAGGSGAATAAANSSASSSSDNIERAVLRMAQLVDNMAGGSSTTGGSSSGHLVTTATDEELAEVAQFFAESDGKRKQHQEKNHGDSSSSISNNVLFLDTESQQHFLFVSACDGSSYHPHTVEQLVYSMPRKNVSEAKYSFENN